jgi:hypothetical protein
MNGPRIHEAAPSERARACRRWVRRQALKAAGVSALPVLGADLFINGRLLVQTIERINEAYGLSPAQIAALPPAQRTRVDEITAKLGTYLIGRAVTEGAIMAALRTIGLRVGAQQAAKFAPAVGLAASALLSGWMFLRLAERHIAHCEQVRAELPLLPAPDAVVVVD